MRVVSGFDSEKLMLLSACPSRSKWACPLCSFARWPSPRWRRCWSKALGSSLGSMPRTMRRLGSPHDQLLVTSGKTILTSYVALIVCPVLLALFRISGTCRLFWSFIIRCRRMTTRTVSGSICLSMKRRRQSKKNCFILCWGLNSNRVLLGDYHEPRS